MEDLRGIKLGPCPNCGDFKKPCRCWFEQRIAELEAENDELEAKLSLRYKTEKENDKKIAAYIRKLKAELEAENKQLKDEIEELKARINKAKGAIEIIKALIKP